MTTKKRKTGLGRGLGALIPDIEVTDALSAGSGSVSSGTREYFQCRIEDIRPNPYQPRRQFREEDLEELCNSIRQQGVIQPVLVRRADIGYELIAGERRLRAAKKAGFSEIPAILKDISDRDMLEISIVENVQRTDLNPMEESASYHRLMEEFGMTQQAVADRVGKSRPAVANFIRLRHLPEPVKEAITEGELTMGHARALLGLESTALQESAFREIILKKLSVRQTEALVNALKEPPKEPKTSPPPPIWLEDLTSTLTQSLGTRVNIIRKGEKGQLRIDFYSDGDLERLVELIRPRE